MGFFSEKSINDAKKAFDSYSEDIKDKFLSGFEAGWREIKRLKEGGHGFLQQVFYNLAQEINTDLLSEPEKFGKAYGHFYGYIEFYYAQISTLPEILYSILAQLESKKPLQDCIKKLISKKNK